MPRRSKATAEETVETKPTRTRTRRTKTAAKPSGRRATKPAPEPKTVKTKSNRRNGETPTYVAIWDEVGEPESVAVTVPAEMPTGRIGKQQQNALDFMKSRGRKKTTAQMVIDHLDVSNGKDIVGQMLHFGKLEVK